MIASIQLLEVIKALAPVATAVIAFVALKNWQRQDKAKREAEFLDKLLDVAHGYIAEMSKPITLLEFVKLGMASHIPTWEDGENEDKAIKGTISYIEKRGEADAKRMLEVLETVQPSTIALRALAAKGQVFSFEAYQECHNAVEKLTLHFDRLEAVAAIVGSPTMNWEHPEIRDLLKGLLALDPAEFRENVRQSNVVLIEYIRKTYGRIYGGQIAWLK